MSKKGPQEMIEILEKKKEEKKIVLRKVEEELRDIENKIQKIKDSILIKEAKQCQVILSDTNISLLEIAEILKKGDVQKLSELSHKLSNQN